MSSLKISIVLCCAYAAFGSDVSAPRRFAAPTGVDSLIDANPIPLPAVKVPDMRDAESPVPQPAVRDTASDAPAAAFQIQLDALSDMDAAQARKAVLEQALGEKIDVVFDPPYYKLRLGNFATKREAGDMLVDLAEKHIQGFIVKQ
jgi:septal ring-binding cell division protein DamX